MALIKLLILDEDNDYSFNLCNYLTHNYSEMLLVNYYNDSYNIEEWIKKIDPDIILVSEKYYSQVCNQFKDNLILLSPGTNNTCLTDVPSIDKYQDANQIAGCIVNFYTKSSNIITYKKDKIAKIVSVYSATGSAGKTTVAMGISTICSYAGLSVFYLNLEQLSSTSVFFSKSGEYSISDVIYYAKQKDKNLMSKISTMSCKDTASGVHYFKEANNSFEMNELQPQDIELILDTIKMSGIYDLIIIDMDSQLCDNTIAIFKIADEILCIFTNEEICLHKTKLFIDSVNMLSDRATHNTFFTHKIQYVVNKVSNQVLQSPFSHLNEQDISEIPYESKFISLKSLINNSGGPEKIKSALKEIAARYIIG